MFDALTTPALLRSSDERMSTDSVPFTRFRPLNCAASTTVRIWSVSSSMSVWILLRSTLDSCAATMRPFTSVRSSVTVSEALRATATVDSPSARLSEMAMKPLTSESIDLEIAQTAELSLAEATDLPVEICGCVSCRLEFTDFRVCSATMALVFVRMLDMLPFPLLYRRRFRAKGHRVGADPFNRHSDACGPSCRATPHEAVRGRPSRRSMNNVLNRPIAWVSFGENLR